MDKKIKLRKEKDIKKLETLKSHYGLVRPSPRKKEIESHNGNCKICR